MRRLLENGANTSFVNQIADPAYPIDKLLADPVERAKALQPAGRPHDRIALPRDLFGAERVNSTGIDLIERVPPRRARRLRWRRLPRLKRQVSSVDEACRRAQPWPATPQERAACLTHIADTLEARRMELIPTIVREAGKTYANAVGEVREAADFLRYYAAQVRDWSNDTHQPLGVVACISPWNFPLSIFTGQIAGALAAGNGVVAKPAEETPQIATQAVALFRDAGAAGRGAAARDRRRRGRRAAGRQPGGQGRGLHRLDRGRALDQQDARRPAADRAVHRRDRRAERDDGRFLGAARAAGERRADLGVRFGRPALLGAARALRCRRTSPTTSCRC